MTQHIKIASSFVILKLKQSNRPSNTLVLKAT